MSLDVHQIRWRSSYLEIDYSSRDGGVPWLYCVGRRQFVPFEIVGLESGVRRARLNLVLGDGREVLPAANGSSARKSRSLRSSVCRRCTPNTRSCRSASTTMYVTCCPGVA